MGKFFHTFQRIRALSQSGLNHSQDLPHHREQYSGILDACFRIAQCDSIKDYSHSQWQAMLSELGVITPKVGSVVGIFRKDGCMLVLKRQSGRWCLPCGYAEIGETPEDTAKREVFEETGLHVSKLNLIGIKTNKDDHLVPFMWEAVYIAYTYSVDISLSHEHMAAEWIPTVDSRNWHSTHKSHAANSFSAYHKSCASEK